MDTKRTPRTKPTKDDARWAGIERPYRAAHVEHPGHPGAADVAEFSKQLLIVEALQG